MANKNEKTSAEIYREERKARLAKAAKKNSKKSKKIHVPPVVKKVIAVVIVLAIVAGIGINAFNKSAFKARQVEAVEVNGETVSLPEYAFYYNSALLNAFNYSYYYESNYGSGYGVMFTGYDYTKMPDEQKYDGEIEGVEEPTWADFFEYSALESIKRFHTYAALAKEANLALDDEDNAVVNENLDAIKSNATSSGVSVNDYLKMMYGKGVNKAFVKALLEREQLAAKYQDTKMQEYKDAYTDEEIDEYYKAHSDAYNVVSLRFFDIAAEKEKVETTNDAGETSTQEVTTEATRAAAKVKADAFANAVSTEEEFMATAASYAKEAGTESAEDYAMKDSLTLIKNVTKDEASGNLDEAVIKWAFDSARAVGDTYVHSNDNGSSVYMISAPVAKDETVDKVYSVRHILIKFAEENETTTVPTTEPATAEPEAEDKVETTTSEAVTDAVTTTEPTTEAITIADISEEDLEFVDLDVDLETAKQQSTYAKAHSILVEYLNGKQTEESFADLAKKHSEDNAEDGGLYEDVTLGRMVPEFENWATAEGRKVGDVGIVETDYGYHIMYSVDLVENGVTWEYNILEDMAAEDFNAYSEELLANEEYTVTVLNEEGVAGMLDSAKSTVSTWLHNIEHSSSSGF